LEAVPNWIAERPNLVLFLAFVLSISNLLGCLVVVSFAPAFLTLIHAPVRFLVPVVVTLAVIGIVAYRNSTFDLIIAAAVLMLGLSMVRYGYSRAALLLGFILAPFIEKIGRASWRERVEISVGVVV